MKTEQKAILLLGDYRPTLTLARNMKSRGYRVIVGSESNKSDDQEATCKHSNAVAEIWQHAPLSSGPDMFLAELLEFKGLHKNLQYILPVSEVYVRMFAEHEKTFTPLKIISMPVNVVKKCLDKDFMMHLANNNNVPTAPFASTTNSEELNSAIQKIGFPLILRPKDSTRRLNGKKALVLDDLGTLNKKAKQFEQDSQSKDNPQEQLGELDLLVQKKFAGKRHNIYFAAHEGKLVRCAHAIIKRTNFIDGTGLAVEGITLPPEGDLVEQTKQLLNALNYSGIGCAQFLVDENDGKSSFLEINPRIAGNHALPEYCGLDLGGFLLDSALLDSALVNSVLGKPLDLKPVFGKAGMEYCWTSGDLMGIKLSYLRKEINIWVAFRLVARAMRNAVKAKVHMVFHWQDMKPAIMDLFRILPRFSRWKNKVPAKPQSEKRSSTTSGKRVLL